VPVVAKSGQDRSATELRQFVVQPEGLDLGLVVVGVCQLSLAGRDRRSVLEEQNEAIVDSPSAGLPGHIETVHLRQWNRVALATATRRMTTASLSTRQ
jgi:hypothetical protein